MHVPAAPYDARHLFFLISQLIDNNPCLSSSPPMESPHAAMGENSKNRVQSQARLSYAGVHLVFVGTVKTIALQAQKHFSQCTFF